MKNQNIKPTRGQFNILRQICNYIPPHEVSKIARETGAEDKSRTFKPWSHVVSLLYAQLTHSIGLNDLCDSLQLHSGPLSSVRGATAPSRNGLSHANRQRPSQMAEALFWRVMEHVCQQSPGFKSGQRRGSAFRFKMPIHVIDSTTLELVANCMDWAKHRRRKAAAKAHMRLNLQSLLPSFVVVDTAAEHDNRRAREVCADLKSGEIALFDKGYVDFGQLKDLDERKVFWVTRAKENMAYEVIEAMPRSLDEKILKDDFLGHNANAVRWQVWMALLVYVLLRYLSYLSKWAHSFTRLFTILRAVMWEKLDLLQLLGCYGTAGGSFRNLARPEQAYFPGFHP